MSLWNEDIDAERTPLRVLIKRGEFVDAARDNRAVPYKIYYPDIHHDKNDPTFDTNEKFPVIFWSHGLGGTRDGAAFIARYLAAHGYILVHIQHDGTDDSLWRNEKGHPWDAIRKKTPVPWEVTKNRYLDVGFALEELQSLIVNDDVLASISDLSKLGMSGHSFGAMTTQAIAGQAVGQDESPEDYHHPAFKAGILYSPTPNFRLKLPLNEVYGPIRIPLLHMTGTNDESPVEGFGYEKRTEIYDHATGPYQHLFVIDGADHMVFNGSRGKLEDYADIDTDKNIIKITALAWWDAFLKDDRTAYEWLHNKGPENWLGEKLTQHIYKK